MKSLDRYFYRFVVILFLCLFMPILFCIIVWGNDMDYYAICKTIFLVDNKVIFLLCVLFLGLFFAISHFYREKEHKSRTESIIMAVLLAEAFVGIYYINEAVAKEIAFYAGWDVSAVSGTKMEIGENSYFSIYPNNIAITYFLRKLYQTAKDMEGYAYNPDFIWIQMNCLGISIAGFAACMTVWRLIRKVLPVLYVFVLYCACVCFTPWKVIPYTDMYAIAFPIVCVCLYIYAAGAEHEYSKIALLAAMYLLGIFGGMIKATVYIVVIAAFILETVSFLQNVKSRWRVWGSQILVILIALMLVSGYKETMYEEMSFQPNHQVAVTWHHFFLMGLNDETTGCDYAKDKELIGQYQFRPREERNAEELRLAGERIREKGFIGYPYFLLRKMVMTFNDGTFSWWKEGGFYMKDYYPLTAKNNKLTELLRKIFWGERVYTGRFNTYSQCVWLFTLICLPGCMSIRENKKENMLIPLGLLGVVLFQMLFETRARYLICFLPVFMTGAAVGIWKYHMLFEGFLRRCPKFRKERNVCGNESKVNDNASR